MAVGSNVGVVVGVGVSVGRAVGVGVSVAVAVGSTVAVGLGVAVPVALAVLVAVVVGVARTVSVAVGLVVGVGLAIGNVTSAVALRLPLVARIVANAVLGSPAPATLWTVPSASELPLVGWSATPAGAVKVIRTPLTGWPV